MCISQLILISVKYTHVHVYSTTSTNPEWCIHLYMCLVQLVLTNVVYTPLHMYSTTSTNPVWCGGQGGQLYRVHPVRDARQPRHH